MKKHLSTIALVVVLILGLGIMLYPAVSDFVNSRSQARVVTLYSHAVTSQADYSAEWEAANAFNHALMSMPNRFTLLQDAREQYYQTLDVSGTGVIGKIEIPRINVKLAVYHGTSEGVLQAGIGHLEGSSLPTGEIGTHVALSGHRGLPSARLFTDLDRVEVGDIFTLSVLDRPQTYVVDQILTVLPDQMGALAIDPDQAYCTLITCTPYGINTHRLLVRGRLTEPEAEMVLVSNVERIDSLLVATVAAVPMLLLLLLWVILLLRKRGRTSRKER